MKVYVLVHEGEVERVYNIRTMTLQDKLTVDCLGDYRQINGLLSKCRDERYKMLSFSLRAHKSNKKGKQCQPSV